MEHTEREGRAGESTTWGKETIKRGTEGPGEECGGWG